MRADKGKDADNLKVCPYDRYAAKNAFQNGGEGRKEKTPRDSSPARAGSE